MSDPTQTPSQLHGHATYVAGAAKEAMGFGSGAEDKEYAIKEMRAAKEQAGTFGYFLIHGVESDEKLIELLGGEPAKNETVGKIEEKLGSATGCEGMVGEGKERQS